MTIDTDLHTWAREEDHTSQRRRQLSLWGATSLLLVGALVVLFGSLEKASVGVGLSETTDFVLDLEGKKKSSGSPYKATQFISFTINTMGGIDAHGECVGRDVAADGTCYLGSFDIPEDVYHRSLIVSKVLEGLKKDIENKDPEIDHSDDGEYM